MVQLNSSKGKKIASGLAGAAAMAAGSQAYGTIVAVASPLDVVSPGGVNVTTLGAPWDVNGDAVADFQFRFRDNIVPGNWEYSAQVLMATNNRVQGYAGGGYGPYATRFAAAGVPINGAGMVGPTRAILGSRYGGMNYGGFAGGVGNGYLGLRFQINGNDHFGWVCLRVDPGTGAAGVGGIRFCGAAYEDTPNTPILTGAVPEPGSLALLAVGAAALVSRRRKN